MLPLGDDARAWRSDGRVPLHGGRSSRWPSCAKAFQTSISGHSQNVEDVPVGASKMPSFDDRHLNARIGDRTSRWQSQAPCRRSRSRWRFRRAATCGFRLETDAVVFFFSPGTFIASLFAAYSASQSLVFAEAVLPSLRLWLEIEFLVAHRVPA